MTVLELIEALERLVGYDDNAQVLIVANGEPEPISDYITPVYQSGRIVEVVLGVAQG